MRMLERSRRKRKSLTSENFSFGCRQISSKVDQAARRPQLPRCSIIVKQLDMVGRGMGG